jgi:hypothetical protein
MLSTAEELIAEGSGITIYAVLNLHSGLTEVVGGLNYAIHSSQKLVELRFLAISSKYQKLVCQRNFENDFSTLNGLQHAVVGNR